MLSKTKLFYYDIHIILPLFVEMFDFFYILFIINLLNIFLLLYRKFSSLTPNPIYLFGARFENKVVILNNSNIKLFHVYNEM